MYNSSQAITLYCGGGGGGGGVVLHSYISEKLF